MRKEVFIYVGHSNWGKSMALKRVTGGSSRQKTAYISGHPVKVRKMSNDDDGKGLLLWACKVSTLPYQRFIFAFCPKAPSGASNPTPEQLTALAILSELQKSCELYFFVQEEKFNQPLQVISSAEISWLGSFGTVHVLPGQNTDVVRAAEFVKFVEAYI